jgi:hypothetical protein
VPGAAQAAAPNYAGYSDEKIQKEVGRLFRARAAALARPRPDRASAFLACVEMLKTRQEIFRGIGDVRRFTTVEGIVLADAADDSLVAHLDEILDPYVGANPEPVLHPGTEKFRAGLEAMGFVEQWATGFLVHLEMEQALLLLNEFRTNRSPAEAEAAEDAFLRHFAMLGQLYDAQHRSLEDLHACCLANLDWTLGRLESEKGTNDFTVAEEYFAQDDNGFGYFFKLTSPTTGENLEVIYPLPFLTAMDEGWPEYKRQLERTKKEQHEAKPR